MNTARKAAATVVNGELIYTCGGTNKTGYIDKCEWTTINTDGLLESWHETTSLNAARGYTAAVIYNQSIYVLGGANGDHGENLLNTAERAHINADGNLESWVTEKNTMLTPRRGLSAIAANGYLYAIGGYNGLFLDTIERAKILNDGSLGEWQEISQMLHGRYIHSSIKVDKYLYVLGGHKREIGGALSSAEFTEINDDGNLGVWTETAALNIPRYNGDIITTQGFLFYIGGYNRGALDIIERAHINQDGSLSRWDDITRLPSPRSALSVIAHGSDILAIGGANLQGRTLATAEHTQVDNQGRLSAWSE